MKQYIVRSVKYLFALCVIYVAAMWLISTSGLTPLTLEDDMYILLHTSRGWMMIGAAVLLAVFYPRFGFAVKRIEGDLADNRQQILTAMDMHNYRLVSEDDGCMIFRGDVLRRLLALGEDRIEVRQMGQWIVLSGIRRNTVRIAIRMEGYIRNHNRLNEK